MKTQQIMAMLHRKKPTHMDTNETTETNDQNPWRPLEPGEIIQDGDEWKSPYGEWVPTCCVGQPCDPDETEYYRTRRPRPAPKPMELCEGCGRLVADHEKCPACDDDEPDTSEPCEGTGGGDQYTWRCTRCGETDVPPSHVTYQETHDGGCGGACVAEPVNGGGDHRDEQLPWIVGQVPPSLATSEYKYLGNYSAVDPAYSRDMYCDACQVRWTGCWDNFMCPKCGRGEIPSCEPRTLEKIKVPAAQVAGGGDQQTGQTASEWVRQRYLDDLDLEHDEVQKLADMHDAQKDRADRAEAEAKGLFAALQIANREIDDRTAKQKAAEDERDQWKKEAVESVNDLEEGVKISEQIAEQRNKAMAERDALRAQVEALMVEHVKAICFIKELNATKFEHGRQYRSRCGKFLAALKTTNTKNQ